MVLNYKILPIQIHAKFIFVYCSFQSEISTQISVNWIEVLSFLQPFLNYFLPFFIFFSIFKKAIRTICFIAYMILDSLINLFEALVIYIWLYFCYIQISLMFFLAIHSCCKYLIICLCTISSPGCRLMLPLFGFRLAWRLALASLRFSFYYVRWAQLQVRR